MTPKARQIRRTVLGMVHAAQSSHIGSNFSCIDILSAIYDKVDFEHDELVVSKGWAAASVYALNAFHGLIPPSDLLTFNKEGSKYLGLIEPIGVFGCNVGSGSMGHGLCMALGFAFTGKRTIVVMSDGEMDCGTTWECALIAKHHMLNNLLVFVDRNKIQALGNTEDVLRLEPLAQKWTAFGWNVFEINGHEEGAINHVLDTGYLASPSIVICDTIKGKGVKEFEENGLLYHYKNLSDEVYQSALAQLQ